jgi:hypothetical protein
MVRQVPLTALPPFGDFGSPGCAIRCWLLSLSALLAPSIWIRLDASTSNRFMLRIHGDRDSLLAALLAHWADQQLQIPPSLRAVWRKTGASCQSAGSASHTGRSG